MRRRSLSGERHTTLPLVIFTRQSRWSSKSTNPSCDGFRIVANSNSIPSGTVPDDVSNCGNRLTEFSAIASPEYRHCVCRVHQNFVDVFCLSFQKKSVFHPLVVYYSTSSTSSTSFSVTTTFLCGNLAQVPRSQSESNSISCIVITASSAFG